MLGDAGFCGICGLGGAACESGSIDKWVRPGYIAGYAKRAVKNPIPSWTSDARAAGVKPDSGL